MQKNPLCLLLMSLVFSLSFYAQQDKYLDSLKQELGRSRPDSVRVKTLLRIGIRLNNGAAYNESYPFLKQALELSSRKKMHFQTGRACNLLAHYHNFKGQNDSSLQYYAMAMEQYRILNDSLEIAYVYNNIGNAYKYMGNIPLALQNFFLSLSIKERHGEKPVGLASSYSNIGNLYQGQQDTANAMKYFRQSAELYKKGGDQDGLANLYVAIGNLYSDQNNQTLAESYLDKAIAILRNSEDREGYAIACFNFGSMLFRSGKFDEAEKYYLKAYEYASTYKDVEGEGSCLQLLAKVRMVKGDHKGALAYLEKGMLAVEGAQFAELKMNLHEQLAEVCEKSGDSKKALLNFRAAVRLKDSIYNAENVRLMTSTELKYTHEKEKLQLKLEQEQKEARQRESDARKNLVMVFGAIFLVALAAFSWLLSNRLRLIKKQKAIIEEHNRETTASIQYARAIQSALLADPKEIERYFKLCRVLYLPRDIVSGDFYWTADTPEKFFIAVCDSTGHGVPGAFVSLLNIRFLNEAIVEKKISRVNEVLDYVRHQLITKVAAVDQKDGMDGVLLSLDKSSGRLEYAAAYNKPVIIRQNTLIELQADKMPVGKGETESGFSLHVIDAMPGDLVFLFTDGFADQFGGDRGKKLMNRPFLNILLKHSDKPEQIAASLQKAFVDWKGDNEQVDDVCVMAIQI